MTEALADSPLLSDPGEYRHGKLIFFDLVGLFMIHYPARIGTIVNAVVSAVIFIGMARKVMGNGRNKGTGLCDKCALDKTSVVFGSHFLSFFPVRESGHWLCLTVFCPSQLWLSLFIWKNSHVFLRPLIFHFTFCHFCCSGIVNFIQYDTLYM